MKNLFISLRLKVLKMGIFNVGAVSNRADVKKRPPQYKKHF